MLHYHGFTQDATKTYIVNEDGELFNFCERVEVTDIFRDILTGTRTEVIKITFDDLTFDTLTVSRKELVEGILSKMCDKGLSLPDFRDYRETLTEILMETEQFATKHYTHDQLGFCKDVEGNLCFLSAESIGRPIVSKYVEYERLKSKGSFEDWFLNVQPYVNDRPELQLAFLIGIAAPVSSLLYILGLINETPVYAFIGKSSQGKSGTLEFIGSCWGSPRVCVDTLTDTDSYLFGGLAERRGWPTLMDDSSTQAGSDFTRLLYTIASSRERGRCNPDGTRKKKREWSGTVIFAGERSMLASTNGYSGLSARVLEFNIQWTKNKETAEELNAVCHKYYGTAHVHFIEHLLETFQDTLETRFNESLKIISERYGVSTGVQRRQAKLIAILYVTLLYATEVFAFDFNVPAIEKLLEETYKANVIEESEDDKLYNSLKEKVVANHRMFPKKKEHDTSGDSVWGEDGYYNHAPCIWIKSDVFVKFLEEEGHKDVKYAVNLLREKKYLAKFSGDRYKVRHKLGGIEVLCYALYTDPTNPHPPKAKKKKVNDSKSQLKALILDDPDDGDDTGGS